MLTSFSNRAPWIALFLGLAVLTVLSLPGDAYAQAYTRLQVLLPGEQPAPGTPSGRTGTANAQSVGLPFTITVRACDDNWNTQTSITSLVQILCTDVTASLPGTTNLVAGEIQLSVTLNASGTFSIQAHDLTDPTIPDGTSSAVTAMVLQGFEFSRINQKNQNAGQAMQIDLWGVDPVGGVVTGYNGPVRLRQLTSFGEGRVEPNQVTLVDGSWSGFVTMYRADETSINRGNVNLYAFLESDPSRNGTSDPFTVHPGTFARLQIVVPGETAEPGSVSGVAGFPASQGAGQAFPVDVHATDEWWNPVPSSDTVRIISSDPIASTPVTGALSSGYRQFTVSLGTNGAQTLTVTDQTNGSIQGMTSAPIQVVPNNIGGFTVDPFSTPVTAGQSVTVTIRATDSSGNTVPGYDGAANVAANTGPGSITPESITFSNGVWTGDMTFRGAGGAVAFTVSDFSSPPNIGTSANFQVLPGPFTKLLVRLPGESSQGGTTTGLGGAPDDQAAGSSFDITVRAVDDFWNLVPGVNDAISLSSSDAFAQFPTGLSLANGEVQVSATLFLAGLQTITATDLDSGSIGDHTSSQVNIVPGNYQRLLLIAPGEVVAPGTAEGRAGAATDQSINYAFTVEVFATDNWFNPVAGVTDVVRLTSNDPLAQLPGDGALVDGRSQLSVRLSTGGFQQITAENVTQPSIPSSTTQVRAISSGFHLEAVVTPTTVQAGELFDLTVEVVNDAGSVIQEINTFIDITVRNAASGDFGVGTLLTNTFQLLQGARTIQLSYTAVEQIQLVITDEAGNDPAVTEVITVTPGDPDELVLTSNPPWLGGNKHATISAQVVDAFGNGVPLEPVAFSLLSGMGTLTPIDFETDDAGVATADFLSPRQPEVGRIRATAGALVTELDLETAFFDPNAAGGTVTNYPNPFHPGEIPTTIAYKLNDNATVSFRIYTLSGGLVIDRTFAAGSAGGLAGLNEVTWDGRNGQGEIVTSGGYILQVQAEGNGETLHTMRRKIAVVR